MRKFKTSAFGEIVDLDDPITYDYLPNNINELRDMMFREIGYSYCYMNNWYKDIFDKSNQKKRVKKLIEDFTKNERANYDNVLWYKEQIFLFTDEIENMC